MAFLPEGDRLNILLRSAALFGRAAAENGAGKTRDDELTALIR
jgi:hypothetical protein